MTKETKDLLTEAYNYCIENEKSSEFMLEYMQDFANVDLDTVLDFIKNLWKKK